MQVERDYPLDLGVAAGMFVAVLDRMPGAVLETGRDVSNDAIVELMLDVIVRGLLNGHVVARPPVTS
jgi:hypothetical protein